MPSDWEKIAEGVAGLRASVDGLRADTQELHDYGRRNRALIRRQWAITVVVVVLAVGIGLAVLRANHAADLARKANDRVVVSCEAANSGRKLNSNLWNYVLSIPPARQMTPQEKAITDAQVANFRAYIAKTFVQQDCSKLKP
jgi:hypothetical protein